MLHLDGLMPSLKLFTRVCVSSVVHWWVLGISMLIGCSLWSADEAGWLCMVMNRGHEELCCTAARLIVTSVVVLYTMAVQTVLLLVLRLLVLQRG